MVKILFACLIMTFSTITFADEEQVVRELAAQIEMGNISLRGAEYLMYSMAKFSPENFPSFDLYEDAVLGDLVKASREKGFQIEGENKLGAGTIIRIIAKAMKPGTAQAGTHDGHGNCTSGCGRGGH